ncbi:Gfo/Idh/MocA family oxidoreductase [Candidatus Thorarchaeota archaeon]|nr:MAG: Gfo/Idh/MocA family oxidoreductase [Candidatus Thorarchaeota archaeon]
MSEEEELRLGLIGTGKIGRAHLTALSSLKNAKLANFNLDAISDTNIESLDRAAIEYGVPNKYDDYRDLLKDEKIDAVYICTPTSKHTDIVKAAAKAGKAIYCEEPLANSCPQARTLMAVTQDANVQSGSGLVLRYEPFLLYAKHLLSKYDFGRPMLAHIRADRQYTEEYDGLNKWRGEAQIAGGGTLSEHCVHDIDILAWFFGEIAEVQARVGFISGRGVEDIASITMVHKDGSMSTLDSIWHDMDRLDERRIEFFFEKGFILITLESGKRYLDYHLKGEGPVRIHAETADLVLLDHLGIQQNGASLDIYGVFMDSDISRYAALSYAFINSISSGESPSPNFSDAVNAHMIVDAAYESANNGTSIKIL